MNWVLTAIVRLYRWVFSPALHAWAGPGVGCRFEPSCSAYFEEALGRHGWMKGTQLGVKRVARCHPWAEAGFDPVPQGEEKGNREEQ